MPLHIPQEQMQMCSSLISERLGNLDEMGVGLQDPRRYDLAGKIVKETVPDLLLLAGQRTLVESNGVFVFGEEQQYYPGAVFVARLARVSLEKVVHVHEVEGMTPLSVESNDIALVFRPQIEDPDPVDLIFGEELSVAMRSLSRLELALTID